jgi:predicted transcriptional regulator
MLARLIDVVRMQRRSWPGITLDILEATLTPSNKMRVMYKSNLNFERFNRYFYDLLRKGFIEEKNGSNGRLVYKTTERGRTLLEVLRKAQDLFFSEEQ